MKIKLTIDDVLKLLPGNLPITTEDIEIIGLSPVVQGMHYSVAVATALNRFPDTYQKIAAIKELLTLVPGLGLGEAKMAIENPWKAIQHFTKTGEPLKYD